MDSVTLANAVFPDGRIGTPSLFHRDQEVVIACSVYLIACLVCVNLALRSDQFVRVHSRLSANDQVRDDYGQSNRQTHRSAAIQTAILT